MNKKSEYLKDTLKELETAFQEWDKILPDVVRTGVQDDQASDNQLIKEKAKTILNKLKSQIDELSE